MIRVLVVLAVAAALSGHSDRTDTYPKNPDIDALNYAFDIVLSDATDEVVGSAVVDLRFRAAGVDVVRLDLIEPRGDGRGMTVDEVSTDGRPLDYRHIDDALTIRLPSPSTEGQRSQIRVDYRGTPATGLIIGPNKYGDRSFFSDNWPNKARHWLPTIDHPYDKATSEFRVTAPNHYQVISNGLLLEQTDLGDDLRLTHWKQSVPIATWLYALGVARFAVQRVDEYEGVEIQTWVYPQDREAGFHDFAVPTRQAMEFYSDRVGPYSYEKLANVQSNSVGGGMEAATAIFYGDDSVTGNRSVRWRNVIIHEVAHQWFGNAVTEYDWDDVWLSEGFATYFTLLFIEHQYGREEFLEGLRASRDRILPFVADNPDYRIVHDNLDDMSRVTTGAGTYQKGGWVLHMLRGVTGDVAFWDGIQTYYREFRDGNATTADFRRHMEEASGLDLQTFFHQWLYSGGLPEYEGNWVYDSSAGAVEIEIDQVQSGDYRFEMPIQIAIDIAGERQIETLRVVAARNRFVIPVEGEPDTVVLDPGTWVLMEAEFGRRR